MTALFLSIVDLFKPSLFARTEYDDFLNEAADTPNATPFLADVYQWLADEFAADVDWTDAIIDGGVE